MFENVQNALAAARFCMARSRSPHGRGRASSAITGAARNPAQASQPRAESSHRGVVDATNAAAGTRTASEAARELRAQAALRRAAAATTSDAEAAAPSASTAHAVDTSPAAVVPAAIAGTAPNGVTASAPGLRPQRSRSRSRSRPPLSAQGSSGTAETAGAAAELPRQERAIGPRASRSSSTVDPISSVAEDHAECPICFEALPSQQTVLLLRGGERACRHFFHEACVCQMASSSSSKCCPLCRADFDSVLRVPDVERSPEAWFAAVDSDGNGTLDCTEVLEVLKATLPVDCAKLEKALPPLFAKWDPDGDGRIDYTKMMGPNGLYFYVRDKFRRTGKEQSPPDIRTEQAAWFRYWDEDGSGSLEREEVVRALAKTFAMTSAEQIQALRELLDAVWSEFDPDGSGSIDMLKFCRPGDGLAEFVTANLVH
mmetsp:Transcript_34820/g.96097  ORF Transcript_34820/g.96097 Transcript_34820/m.96097 type:complete len:429 (-) Transcript_34820:75-1361(-)